MLKLNKVNKVLGGGGIVIPTKRLVNKDKVRFKVSLPVTKFFFGKLRFHKKMVLIKSCYFERYDSFINTTLFSFYYLFL